MLLQNIGQQSLVLGKLITRAEDCGSGSTGTRWCVYARCCGSCRYEPNYNAEIFCCVVGF